MTEQRYLRPGWVTQHVFNRFVRFLTRRGLSVYGSRELRVRGRKSGEWRTTPVNLLELDGQRYLVAPRGVTHWVRNLRAAGTGELRVGRRVQPFSGEELADADKTRVIREYLRRWGYTAKKPARHARRQDPDEVRQWLERTYPALKARARKERAEIHWCDETGIVADHCSGYGYARKGQRATMEVPDPHIGINMVSSITNEGALRFMTYPGTMTGERFVVFLGRLLRSTTGKIFLIVDRLKVHQGGVVKQWVAAHADRLEVFELPRRAPERNPDEYLNNDVKRAVTAGGLPDSKPALRERLQHVMRKLGHLPKHVVSYFLHPCVLYAAAAC